MTNSKVSTMLTWGSSFCCCCRGTNYVYDMRAFNCEPRSNRQCMQYLFNYLFIKQTDDRGKSGGELGRLGRHRPWHVQRQPNTAIGKTATATANGHCKWHCAYVTCAQSDPHFSSYHTWLALPAWLPTSLPFPSHVSLHPLPSLSAFISLPFAPVSRSRLQRWSY